MRMIDADRAKEIAEVSMADIFMQTATKLLIDKVPTIDAVPVVHGRWIDMYEDETTEGLWRCSVCGSDRYFDILTPEECGCYYCPNCGAKMDGEGNGNKTN